MFNVPRYSKKILINNYCTFGKVDYLLYFNFFANRAESINYSKYKYLSLFTVPYLTALTSASSSVLVDARASEALFILAPKKRPLVDL